MVAEKCTGGSVFMDSSNVLMINIFKYVHNFEVIDLLAD